MTSEAKLQKTTVTCKTCGISESFYSSLSLNYFKMKHLGHSIDKGGRDPPHPGEEKPVPKEEKRLDVKNGTRLSRVVVDLVVFSAMPEPLFRVRGFRDDIELCFVVTSPSQSEAKVKELLANGQYLDHGFTGLLYVWAPEAVEYEEEARKRLHLPLEPAKDVAREMKAPEPAPRLDYHDASTVAKTSEVLFETPGPEEPAEEERAPPPFPSLVEHIIPEVPQVEEAPKEIERTPATQSVEERPFSALKTIASVPSTPLPPVVEEDRIVENASEEPQAGPEEDYLLVSKSWYIQEGARSRSEAIRVSKVLKAFRWRVEPMYTIGVMLEDILSIEASRNEVSRAVIWALEDAGYRFTAVSVEQGKLSAWFKKRVPKPPSLPGSGAVTKTAGERT